MRRSIKSHSEIPVPTKEGPKGFKFFYASFDANSDYELENIISVCLYNESFDVWVPFIKENHDDYEWKKVMDLIESDILDFLEEEKQIDYEHQADMARDAAIDLEIERRNHLGDM